MWSLGASLLVPFNARSRFRGAVRALWFAYLIGKTRMERGRLSRVYIASCGSEAIAAHLLRCEGT
jgi:hypothetical protein